MNNREAMQALLDGKKIRHAQWDDKSYFFLSENGFFFIDQNGQYFDPSFRNGEWEISEEPTTNPIHDFIMEKKIAALDSRLTQLEARFNLNRYCESWKKPPDGLQYSQWKKEQLEGKEPPI